MSQQPKILDLAQSMEQTMEIGNLSMITDVGEAIMDSALDDGILKDIPILGSVVGAGKCIKNISDVLFTNKLIAFLTGLKDADAEERKAAILKWESDAKYRINVGETLLNMVDRCDDTLKAQWLSKLFYVLVLKEGMGNVFMRAEKVLSGLSVMDVMLFLDQPEQFYQTVKIADAEPFFNSGLYVSRGANLVIDNKGYGKIDDSEMNITEVGLWIYRVLNGI